MTAAHHRLIHQRTAADVDALCVQAVFFEDKLVAHDFKQVMGNTYAAVADFHGFRLYRLGRSPRRIYQQSEPKESDGAQDIIISPLTMSAAITVLRAAIYFSVNGDLERRRSTGFFSVSSI